jgi:hypothetical protein
MHGNRIRLRQQLEKERLELERQREEKAAQVKREMVVSQQTPSMDVPASGAPATPNQVTIEVPNNVLEVSKGCSQRRGVAREGVRVFRVGIHVTGGTNWCVHLFSYQKQMSKRAGLLVG